MSPCVLAVLVCGLALEASARKVALIVAINAYGKSPGVPASEQWAPLAGSLNDAAALSGELARHGFEVVVLANEQATRAGIEKAFETELLGRISSPDDVVFFHFSGHGQQIPDDNGDPDEVDGYDESLVPFDNRGRKDYSKNLRDEHLGAWIAAALKKTPNVVVSLDSCHSGTATRGELTRRGGKAEHPATKHSAEALRALSPDSRSGLFDTSSASAVVLTATRPEEYARESRDEASGETVGVFTRYLVAALRSAGPGTSYRALMDSVAVRVSSEIPDQHPQLEGPADRGLFGGAATPPERYVRVGPRTPDGLIPVHAGSLHGIAVGTVLGLYGPQGPIDRGAPPARARVIEVELGTCLAEPLGKAAGDLLARGGRAIELETRSAPGRLRVLAPSGFADAIGSARIAVAAEDGTWDVRITSTDSKVRLSRIDGSDVPIPRGPGEPMDLALPADHADLSRRLAEALRVEHRRRKITGLLNQDPSSHADVELRVHRVDAVVERGPDGRKRPRVTRDHGAIASDGAGKLPMGAIIRFTVENRSAAPLYMTIIELAADGSIAVLYPPKGRSGGEHKVGAGEARNLDQILFRMSPPVGPNVWKLIATEDDVDFRVLELAVRQGTTRGGGSGLQRLMADALGGTRSEPFGYEPTLLWGTDLLSVAAVTLKKKSPGNTSHCSSGWHAVRARCPAPNPKSRRSAPTTRC